MQKKLEAKEAKVENLEAARAAAAEARAAFRGESNHAKGRRFANMRVNALLGIARRVGNLGAAIYELTDAEKQKIIETAFGAIHDMKRRLENKTKRNDFDL